jgi:rhodanese-related sulfurtransferase
MRNPRRRRSLIASVAALTLVLGACGGADDTATEEAPLALDLQQPQAPAAPAVPTEQPAVFDLAAAVDVYVSTIPAGFMTAGNVEAFKEALAVPGTVLIDVREAGELADGVIPGAIHIPIRDIPANLDRIPTDRPVIVYCASGWRAGLTVSSLRMMGYDNVVAFTPSWRGWAAAGEPAGQPSAAESFGAPTGLTPELVAAAGDFLATLPAGFLTNSLEAVQEAISAGAALVDVREPSEYEEGFIEDAISIPIRQLVAQLDDVPTDRTVIVYCLSGYRASLTLPILHVLGRTNAQGFPGSFNAWVDAGLAVSS